MFGQSNANSIKTGATFTWMSSQPNPEDSAILDYITIDGTEYNTFVVPTSYELSRLGFEGDSYNKIYKDDNVIESTSASSTWDSNALLAFRDHNLNHYFTSNHNGENICNDFSLIVEVGDAPPIGYGFDAPPQVQTIFYDPAIPANEDGVLLVTERNANNCFHIAIYGTPAGGGPEELLGQTFINANNTAITGPQGGTAPDPSTNSDYWLSDRVNDNNGTIGIALFYLSDIVPLGANITKIQFRGSTSDHGDGKFLLLQKYAVDQQLIECLGNTYNGDLTVLNNAPAKTKYTLESGPITGNLVLNTDGTYTYTPPSTNFMGDVEFQYKLQLVDPNEHVVEYGSVKLSYVARPPAPTYDITCNTANEFTVEITSPIGTDPDEFEYSIDGGTTYQTTTTFDKLPEGNYTINVRSTFTNCDLGTSTATLDLFDLKVNGSSSEDACSPTPSGKIDLTVTGGLPNYTYSWTGPNSFTATTKDLTSLEAGNYTVTVTDDKGCSTDKSFTINTASDSVSPTGTTPNGTTNINACPVEVDIDAIVTTVSDITAIEAAYTDNCGTVTASFVDQTLTGDQCAWSLERTYTVSDGIASNDFDITITHSGSDQQAATGIAPSGTTNIDACPIEVDIDAIVTTASDITAIEAAYSDNCGIVTASFLSQTLSGDHCAWSLERTYTVSDGCMANDFDITITHTGSDQQAATGIAPSGTTNIDACPIEVDIDAIVTTASDITAIEAAYTDNCGIVTASFVSQTLSGDQCAWSLERTYSVSDGCSANDFDITITHTGSDQQAATGIAPSGTTNIDACPIEADIDAIVTTVSDILAIEAAYTDNCGTVTAT
ncbi:hypothetical protein KO493_09990, partial [Tamlana agarivorans]